MSITKPNQKLPAPQIKVRTDHKAGENCAKVERFWKNEYQRWLKEAQKKGCA